MSETIRATSLCDFHRTATIEGRDLEQALDLGNGLGVLIRVRKRYSSAEYDLSLHFACDVPGEELSWEVSVDWESSKHPDRLRYRAPNYRGSAISLDGSRPDRWQSFTRDIAPRASIGAVCDWARGMLGELRAVCNANGLKRPSAAQHDILHSCATGHGTELRGSGPQASWAACRVLGWIVPLPGSGRRASYGRLTDAGRDAYERGRDKHGGRPIAELDAEAEAKRAAEDLERRVTAQVQDAIQRDNVARANVNTALKALTDAITQRASTDTVAKLLNQVGRYYPEHREAEELLKVRRAETRERLST